VFVNAHGCSVITRERLPEETLVMMKLVSNDSSKRGRVEVWSQAAPSAAHVSLAPCRFCADNFPGLVTVW
jgi:hypothetical protein